MTCQADPFHLRRVFRKLLDNALAACKDPVEIRLTCAPAVAAGRPGVAVGVRDNGPGIPREQGAKIFEPFFTTKVHGTGLGLAICKRIIEAHGGEIRLADTPGPGTEFVITLPRRRL